MSLNIKTLKLFVIKSRLCELFRLQKITHQLRIFNELRIVHTKYFK